MPHWTENHRCGTCVYLHCYWCGVAVSLPQGKRQTHLTATREHLKPRARGGRGGANIVVACQACNVARGHNMEWVPFHDRGLRKMPTAQWAALARFGRIDGRARDAAGWIFPLDVTAV